MYLLYTYNDQTSTHIYTHARAYWITERERAAALVSIPPPPPPSRNHPPPPQPQPWVFQVTAARKEVRFDARLSVHVIMLWVVGC